MRLIPYSDGDLWLTQLIERDARMMKDLGGVVPEAEIPERHRKRVATLADGNWWFKLVPDGGEEPAGVMGIWKHDQDGATISEMGWMVLPAFQGRGVATLAGRLILDRARAEKKFGPTITAHPGAANAASNALCRTLGFTKFCERELPFRGSMLRAAVWRLDL